MLTVVTWKWQQPGYAVTFTAEHVNILFRMIERHYHGDIRRVCVTDDPIGLDGAIEAVPLWPDLADVPNPHGAQYPSCYRRLKAFSPDMRSTLGDRFVSLDLDVVITGDLTPLFQRDGDFVIWRDPLYAKQVSGSLFLLTTGSRPDVWTRFHHVTSPKAATAAGYRGSDQAWISFCGQPSSTWTKHDGVFSYRVDLDGVQALPETARLVVFHGLVKPWDASAQRLEWVRAAWQ